MRIAGISLLIVVVIALAGCTGTASTTVPGTSTAPASTAPESTTVHGRVTAGPVCPVERPGDPACAPRPVAGATILVKTTSGGEVARATTMADGSFTVALPAGDYVLVPQHVDGLLGTADQIAISVPANGGPSQPSPLEIQYDTGIR
jgi:carboxypeptidase family protein